jgi:septal ring factor EnvC (AmiA/AmiB activator)
MPDERKPLNEMLKAKFYQLPENLYEMVYEKLNELDRRSTELLARHEKTPSDVTTEVLTLRGEYIALLKSIGDLKGMEDRISELEEENEALRKKKVRDETLLRKTLDAIKQVKPYLEEDKED